MRNRLMVLGVAALMMVAVAMVAGVNVSPVVAEDGLDGACGPIGIGWTCSCTSTIVPNVVCLVGGEEGHVIVTTCRRCPPPCKTFPCYIQPCQVSTSYSCG